MFYIFLVFIYIYVLLTVKISLGIFLISLFLLLSIFLCILSLNAFLCSYYYEQAMHKNKFFADWYIFVAVTCWSLQMHRGSDHASFTLMSGTCYMAIIFPPTNNILNAKYAFCAELYCFVNILYFALL